MRSPIRTINDIMASDSESMPSAVATTDPLIWPIIISAMPMLTRVTTEILAIRWPATRPSFTRSAGLPADLVSLTM